MTPTTPTIVFLGADRLALPDRDLLGEGGEGRVYRARGVAVKVYATPTPAREAKLRSFPTGLPRHVVAPLELCTDSAGNVVGFTMRALDHAVDLRRFGQRRWQMGQASCHSSLDLFRQLAETIAALHERGVVVGDLNDGNVAVTGSAGRWTPWLIDADSMQFGAFRCVVAHERFLDPRLYGVNLATTGALDASSDWYALAVLLFSTILCVHPFGGAHPRYPTLLRRAEARVSVLRDDVKLPSAARRPDILPDDALAWFLRVFEEDLREPLPRALLEARFVRCSCGAEHARIVCPVCTTRAFLAPVIRATGNLRATELVRATGGRIVTATVHDRLLWLMEKDGVLHREDGSVVLRRDEGGLASEPTPTTFFADPHGLARLEESATWIGTEGRMWRITRADGSRDATPVGRVRSELGADVGPAGLVHVDGGTLVRATEGTRIGQILDGQTHVRVGAALGFAFYRASALTVAFVFDPRRGPLRQIENFPSLEGRLVGFDTVFDEAHVLVTFALENEGRLLYVAHLVDRDGVRIASETSADPRASAVTTSPSVTGRALAGGFVLVAGPEGLVLLRPDPPTRTFVPVRLFPEAKELVSPEADLLVGPGGSLYVVTDDAITHLCFHDGKD